MKKLVKVGITGIEPIKVCQIQEPPLYLSLFPNNPFYFHKQKGFKQIYKFHNMSLHRERESNPQARQALLIRTFHLCDLSRYIPTLISQPK